MKFASTVLALLGAVVAERKTFTAYTQPITLEQGGISNAFHVLKIPKGPIAVYRFAGDIVEIAADGTVIPTPTYDAYLHHHVVGSRHKRYANQEGKWTPMKPKGAYRGVGFGAGTEARGTPQEFHYPYAFFTTEGEDEWIANVHILNTRQMSPAQAHRCLECPCTAEDDFSNGTINGVENPHECSPQLLYDNNTVCNFATYTGGLWCCNTGEFCLEKNELPAPAPPTSTYYMRYTIDYDEIQPENKELYLAGCCDASGDLLHHGAVEYDVPKCNPDENPGCVYTISARQHVGTGNVVFDLGEDYTLDDREVELVYAVGHQHRAGLGIHLYNDTTDEHICSSMPTYGNGTVAGNENGYVIAMSTCTFDPPLRMRTTDVLRIVASYDSTLAHTGVMSLWYLAIADVPKETTTKVLAPAASTDSNGWGYVVGGLVAVAVAATAAVVYRRHTRQGYAQVEGDKTPATL
ncbi:hypothetical protein SDRG_05292 [Saprolegnia diclina VS20]|uniref:Uncharacterized protein n=1 Tax=Saprolegnia diclina (strain VS20) TaxID=1156394 RepID=T0QST6_SAPDV|nr:hypothetical protein SDRG_05292 [Saprolegnia diclina VS20]EQC37065.1 hypothetical protein SDRG_05292 [Saprolegnia diclina VS20]|eukprot:XP_008609227.1 hypothetical protein SDRG_05292 [Saprolegnia diclina VS20]